MPQHSTFKGICLALGMAASLFISGSSVSAAEEPKFIADIPLMPDTALDTLRSISFDTADGRVFVLFVQVAANEETIRAFYSDTLTALGWEVDGQVYVRRGEILKLKAAPQAGDNVWKVTLSPRPLS